MAAKKKVATKKATEKKSRNRTPDFVNHPAWSEAKFWGFVRAGLRSTYNKWPPKWSVIEKSKRRYEGQAKNQKWEYLCAVCNEYHKQKDINVDHIVACGSLNSFADLPGFVERLFTNEQGLRVVCTSCHKIITAEQRTAKKEET